MRRFSTALIGVSLLLVLSSCGAKPKAYAYPAWGFTVSFSAAPKVTETPASADGTPHSILVEDSSGGHDFAASSSDITSTASTEDILDKVPVAVASSLGATVDGTTYAATITPTGAVTGHEVRLAKGGKTVMVMRVFVYNGRLYQVGGSSLLGPDDASTKQFLESLRLTGGPAPATTATNAS